MAYNENAKKSIMKYLEKLKEIRFRVKPEVYEAYRQASAVAGYSSMRQFYLDAIETKVGQIMRKCEFSYGMRLRGFSPGCQPKEGLDRREDDPSGKYHDVLVYKRMLSDEELSEYELDFIGTTYKGE